MDRQEEDERVGEGKQVGGGRLAAGVCQLLGANSRAVTCSGSQIDKHRTRPRHRRNHLANVPAHAVDIGAN